MTTPIAELQDVTRRFGTVRALDGVSISIAPGEVVAVLGPNGAGKTTAVDVLLGALTPTTGQARLFGGDPHRLGARRRIGSTPQELGFPSTLTARELLGLVRAHYPRPLAVQDVIVRFGLEEIADRHVGGLSLGQRRRIAIAFAFIGRPDAVFLDEPTTGLDVAMRRHVWDDIRGYVRDGGTLFLTTHHIEEAEALATRVAVLNAGRIVFDGAVEALKGRTGVKKVRIRVPVPAGSGAIDARSTENGVTTLTTHDPDRLVKDLLDQGLTFGDLEVTSLSLEDAVLELTGGPR
ncbi:MAG TPA: ABC transporter ATP-binding protein [Candidatus Elarobacter sp.]|jgi:ABC-2 type transport system ATP-binding protein